MWLYNITNRGEFNDDSGWYLGGWDYLNSEEGRTYIIEADIGAPVTPGVLRITQEFGDFLPIPHTLQENFTAIVLRKDLGPFNITQYAFNFIRE